MDLSPITSPLASARRTRTSLPNLSHVAPQQFNEPIARVNKESIHWKRKVFHVLGIGTVALAYPLTPVAPLQAAVILAVFTLIFGGLDTLRFFVPALNTRVKKDFGPFMRNYELDGLSGSTWFLIASVICAALLPKLAASLGFLCVAIGDPIASFVGLRWGRIKLPGGKSLEGSMALVGVSALGGIALLTLVGGLSLGVAALIAAPTALAAAFAEWLPIKRVDDNFIVPIVSGAAAAGLFALVV